MLRSQKDVDNHVRGVFRNISNEKERNLRCYNVAKLYHKVGDYQSTKKYVELYLRERPDVAGAHKLLGQALEGLKEYSKALQEYKCSLSLESRQPDLVLKVCELVVESKTKLDAGEAKYWSERAEEVSDNHQTVFRFKEYLIKMEDGSGDQAQLGQLIKKEIEVRPEDPVPRTRLLNLYKDTRRVSDAYKYAIDLETRCLFRDSIQWYSCVEDILKAYHQEVKNPDWEFYVNQLCVLERYAALCSREQQRGHSAPFTSALFALDQACFEASKYCLKSGEQLLQECLRHVSGQLAFHLGTALMRIGKQSRTGWKEWIPSAWALMTLAYSTPETVDFASHSSSQSGKERHRKLMKYWKEDCAFRCSQAGHILLSMPSEKKRFTQLNIGTWRSKIYTLLFVKSKPDSEKSSFFMTDGRFADVHESSVSVQDVTLHDDLSQCQQPDSLHALVWLGLRYVEPVAKQVSSIGVPYVLPFRLSPSFSCHVFDELKLSTSCLENGGVETLSRLDVDTFLFASVFCAVAAQDEQQFCSIMGEGRPLVLPLDLTEQLCSEAQSKWWSSAYRLHSNKSRSDIGEMRMVVARGLEVVRLLGNHGMDVRLVVLLAKLFTEKASAASTPKDNIPDISKRAHMFWQCAITLLERMEKNQPLRMPGNSLFSFVGKELTSSEVKILLEEGRFFMACHLMKEGKCENAIEAFQDLKNPYASFYEGLMYKKLADAEIESVGDDKITTEMKNNYVSLLQKSRSAFYLTLDRLRSPQNAGNHPLNGELEEYLEDVESCLAREEVDFALSTANRTSQDALLDESFNDSLNNASRFVNISHQHTLLSNLGYAHGHSVSHGLTSTPLKTKRNIKSEIIEDLSGRRVEARPSPERQEAQMRRMATTLDKVMEQNVLMLNALDKTRGAVEDLQKQMSDLRLEVSHLKQTENRPQPGRNLDHLVHSAEEYDDDVGAAQLRSYQAYQASAPYASFPSQAYNYDNRSAANAVSMHTMLPQALFPQTQVPLPRNVDPNLLPLYYPQAALGLNFHDRQGSAGVAMTGALPGVLPGSTATLTSAVPNNLQSSVLPVQGDSASSVDSYRKSLMGAPILSHSSLTAPAVDLSTSSTQNQHLGTSDLSAQRFSLATHQGNTSMQTSQGRPSDISSHPGESVPHNFQISMPPQATIPTTESLGKCLSPMKPISTEGILPNVPMPTYSAVSSKQSDSKQSRLSTGSASGNDTFTEDSDYNPCADFKPIIPLPEEVTVTTGEEDETPLFVRRAKLFRYVGKEWKERGVGEMKILKHNITGKPRILMRREQVHKICANHFILPEMELSPQTGSDRAWSWAANDFSDGEACIEKLCVRFKTVEDALQFKEAFYDARKLAKSATPVKGSATTATPVSVAKSESKSSTQASPASGKVELGGFSFISPPVLKPVEHQAKTPIGKDKENTSSPPKPSPFAGFSFKPTVFGSPAQSSSSSGIGMFGKVSSSPAVSAFSTAPSSFPSSSDVSSSVSSTTTPIFKSSGNLGDFAAIAAQSKNSDFGKKDMNFKGFEGAGSKVFGVSVSKSETGNKIAADTESGDADEFEPTAVFNPVIPLPSLVEVRTGEEDEDVIFEERAKLLRFDSEGTQWKERGIGKMKVLNNRLTGKVRLLMRREQVLKVCCNHLITPDIRFQPLSTSDKAITWSAQDYAEGEVSLEVFALKFKNPELMHAFKEVVERVQKEITASPQSSPSASLKVTEKKDARPLSELFKRKEGSWECSGCLTVNNADIISCPCCSQPKPGQEAKVKESQLAPSSQFSFGINPTTSQPSAASKPATGFVFGDTSTASEVKQPSLAEMFKPKEGSWVCQACYTRCDQDKLACAACEAPKPGHENEIKERKSKSTFTFGISEKSATSKDKQPSLAEMFKPKEGSWVCQACYTRCDQDKLACAACEAPKPGHENESKGAKSSFSIGTSVGSSFAFGVNNTAGQTSETKGFTFGSSVPQGETKTTYVFGIPSATAADTSKSFSFGTSTGVAATSTDFVFGASGLAPSKQSQPSFGSPHNFGFQMKASSPVKSPGKSPGAPSGEEESEDDEENADVGDFKPVIPLPDKVPVTTGEEDETVLYCHRAKLYRFVGAEWKERGLGDIKVLRHNITNKPRLLMRREQIFKICLNHYILPDLEMIKKDEKTWMWGAQDFSEGVIAVEKFACKFKTPEIAAEFKEAVDKAKAEPILASPVVNSVAAGASSNVATDDVSAAKEVIPSMKNFSFKLPSSDKQGVVRSLFSSSANDDVEVVYEAKVTPEEKDAALKLKLPENFYRYKQAPPCAGCAGCEKDSDSDQGDNQNSEKKSTGTPSTESTFNATTAVFGSGASLFSTSTFGSPSTTQIFGGTSTSNQTSVTPAFGSLFGSGALSSAVNSGSTAFPMLGSKPAATIPEEDDGIPFLPVSNAPTFASLISTSPSANLFKPKETSQPFSFAGAGSKVFGGVSSETSPKKRNNDADGDSGGEHDTSETGGEVETHDPHFEPIIAMPDIVEVRTGEEDEEKYFCQRAKLYRFDTNNKEWKERGVGEMKILKHRLNGTVRLLLRRDQVHKVVLNQRLDAELKLQAMNTSDKAWCWGGMNYAEDPAGALERLAVRFKTSESAQEFFSKVEECQKLLAESFVAPAEVSHAEEIDEEGEGEEEEDDDDEEEEEDDDDDEEDYEDQQILFEQSATLKAEAEDGSVPVVEGTGHIRIISVSDRLFYVEMEDSSGQILCKAPIQGDVEVQREGNVCIWRSADLVDDEDQGIEKKFKTTFSSESEADGFQELYSKITLEIVEKTYDYVDEEED